MGVDIGDIIPAERKKLDNFKGKVIAIDAYNALYQFLSIIRQPNGTPLKDAQGRVTSHLSGLLYRTGRLCERGIKPVYIFDGKPPELKLATVEIRAGVRESAKLEWKEALARGDLETARIKAMQSSRLTKEMVSEAKQLLSYLGMPMVQAPSEGEAQASLLVQRGDAWALGSQDFDCLLFGTPMLIRNLTITGKRKLPRKKVYVDIFPEQVELERLLTTLKITREQLVDVGILVGTDFNLGIRGIGAKKALNMVREHGSLDKVLRRLGKDIEDWDKIRDIFLNPEVSKEYSLKWSEVDHKQVKEFLCERRDFSAGRVEKALQKFEELKRIEEQKSLEEWF